MPFLDNIVIGLNSTLLNSCFQFIPPGNVKLYGISEAVFRVVPSEEEGKDKTERFPATIDDDGEATMIDVDDVYDLIAYHKLESIANSQSNKVSFGDSSGDMLEVANMSLMVMAFRDKIKKTSTWLEAAIKDAIPDKTKVSNDVGMVVQNSSFKIGNTSFEKFNLLGREYSEVVLNYPNLIVFELKYRIESTYKKGCFNACGC